VAAMRVFDPADKTIGLPGYQKALENTVAL
jgi:hypothetical protein